MSNNYGMVERYLGSLLRRFPWIRKSSKIGYQRVSYFLSRKTPIDYGAFVSDTVKISDAETFFGYYDRSPVNSSGTHLLFHMSTRPTYKLPDPSEPINVVVKKISDNEEPITYASSAYNWQQGCRAHWLNNSEFIFNDFDWESGEFVARIVNIENSEINRTVDFPVYESAEKIALSLNFNRLALFRPDYGYRNITKEGNYTLPDDNNDGVFICDLVKNKKRLLISLSYLSKLCEVKTFDSHKVNHIMLNPSRSGFIFLYRYFVKGRKYDCLIFSDIRGKNIKMLSANEIVSHYCWISDTEVVAYMKGPDQRERYYLVSTDVGTIELFGKGYIDKYGDGHPSFINGLLIFDTYPDKARNKKLLVFNTNSDRVTEIGNFYESFRFYGETRCDLHPRILENTNKISVDSVHEGKRQMYLIELNPSEL